MVDYSERRPVNTNRPRKQGMVRYFVLTALGGILAGYGLGLTSGWFIFKPSRQEPHRNRRR
jgi:NhaP-type Na+/H+ or K+/H+ antiporter